MDKLLKIHVMCGGHLVASYKASEWYEFVDMCWTSDRSVTIHYKYQSPDGTTYWEDKYGDRLQAA